MQKAIELGYISMYNWKKGKKLFADWFYEDEDESTKNSIKNCKPSEIILPPNETYELVIDYPLHRPFKTEIKTGTKGLTREEVVDIIVRSYKLVYKEEKATSKIPAGLIPGMYNRNTTDGKYGIWGHELGDLMLHTLEINDNVLTVGIDS